MTKEIWRSRRLNEAERISKLINLANQGYRADELNGAQSRSTFRIEESIDSSEIESFAAYWDHSPLGFEREKYISGLLQQLPYVTAIRHNLPNSNNDQLGIDLIVMISGHAEYSPLLSTVFVQVKSQQQQRMNFKHRMSNRFAFDFENADEELARRQYILLVATEPEKLIIQDFETQLDFIYNLMSNKSSCN